MTTTQQEVGMVAIKLHSMSWPRPTHDIANYVLAVGRDLFRKKFSQQKWQISRTHPRQSVAWFNRKPFFFVRFSFVNLFNVGTVVMWPILKPPETESQKRKVSSPEKCHPEGPHPVLPISEKMFFQSSKRYMLGKLTPPPQLKLPIYLYIIVNFISSV